MPGRLPGVEDQQRQVGDEQWIGARAGGRATACGCGVAQRCSETESSTRVEIDLAADEPAVDLAVARRRARRRRAARAGAFGIVTRTASGRVRSRIASSRRPCRRRRCTPFSRRPPQPRIVVDEAHHALARRLPQLAQQAAAAPAGADDQDAAAARRAARARARCTIARSANRASTSAVEQMQASITKTLREKSPICPCVSVTKPIAATLGDDDRGHRSQRVARARRSARRSSTGRARSARRSARSRIAGSESRK